MKKNNSRIAIFGGTFDPIHLGHLLIAEQAYQQYSLSKIIFMPTGKPPHKSCQKVSLAKHRLAMLKIAIADNPHFSYSQYELNKKEKSYTADTFRYLQKLNLADKIYFIIGSDSLYDIWQWGETKFLLKNCNFIVAPRPNFKIEQALLTKLEPYLDHIEIMDSYLIDISSSKLRNLVSTSQSIRYQTPNKVIDYIYKQGLYRRH